MTSIQVNAELFRTMGIIAEDDGLMMKLLKYAKKLATQKECSATMTEEEFFARVDEAKKQARQGKVHRIETKEELSRFLNSL